MAEVQVTAGSLTENDFHPRNSQPLVSVIIPCYNAEKYVEQAVRSIMNQTYKNLEILITDDCSTDASFAILQKLAEEDAHIKLFRNEYNQKIVRTLNALVERAAGKYIARMDADDISLAKRIETQVQFMEDHKECGLCGCNIFRIDEFGKKLKKIVFPASYSDNTFFPLFSPTLCHPSVLGKREVFIENKYDFAEDYELWLRLLFQKSICIANLTDYLFEYRVFQGQVSQVHSLEQKEKTLTILKKYCPIKKENLSSHLKLFFSNNYTLEASDKKYIQYILCQLKGRSINLSIQIVSRILLFIINSKDIFYFSFLIIIHPLCFLACINGFLNKIGNKL